jgi:uncharacterized lipoprotein YddW (UPF0748 family)
MILFLLTVFFTFDVVLAQTPYDKRELRGAWIATKDNYDWPQNWQTPANQQADLINILNYFSALRMNAAMFQVRPACDAFYQSSLEPWSYYLNAQQGRAPSPFYDPLAFAIEECHKRGIELHAWFNPYRVEVTVGQYPLDSTNVARRHPDWAFTIGTYRLLNPGLSEVRNWVTNVIVDVVRRYDIDGIHFDDYFYEAGVNAQDTATYAKYPRGIGNIKDWRRDNVNIFVKQVFDSIQTIKPWVKYGISPRGIWKNGVPPGTGGADNYNEIYCDAVAWLQGQYIDYINPQLYWPFGGGQDYALLQPWWSSQKNARHMYTGNATYRIGEGTFGPATEIANQIKYNRTTRNAEGNVQFRIKSIMGNLGGIYTLLQNDIFLYPAIVPVMSWKETVPPNAPTNMTMAIGPDPSYYVLSWNAPTAASDGDTARRYLVYRLTKNSATSAEREYPKNLIALTGVNTCTPASRIDSTNVNYYYAVSALDKNNNESGLSNIVTVASTMATPELLLPADGDQYFKLTTALKWNKIAAALMYRIQLATSSTFDAGTVVQELNTPYDSLILSGLVAQKTYYWRVVAGNQLCAGSFSSGRSFKTAWPVVPTPLTPVNDLSASIKPLFSWNRGGGTSFQFQLATSNTFSGTVIMDSVLIDTSFLCQRRLSTSKIYYWRVKGTNAYGSTDWSVAARFMTGTNDVETISGLLPAEFALSQNYPNPFNPTTTITISLPEEGYTSLRVYDVLGREAAELINEHMPAGVYTVRFNATHLPSGVYIYTLTSGITKLSKRMMLVK